MTIRLHQMIARFALPAAVLALAEKTGASGRQVIDALVLGIDVACRVGNCIYPDHYDRGWHITGSTGTLGAAAACARLLKMDTQQTAMALGIAASQPVGMREQFGTMTKPFHPGGAARAGMMSALLASKGFTASPKALEAPRGMMQTVSTKNDWNEITDELGQRFEISFNTFKPFACGIVIHPAIDGAIQLRDEFNLQPEQIKSIHIKANPYQLELCGKKTPQTGLEGKFSVYHSVAIALIDGRAGEKQYSDEAVRHPKTISLREKITVEIDKRLHKKSGEVTITLNDGRVLNKVIESAVGGLENPMTNEQLDEKFLDLTTDILPMAKCQELLADTWRMAELPSAGDFAKSTVA